MPLRCIGCNTTLPPGAAACPHCGRPAPPRSALARQKDIDATQFITLAPGALLPDDLAESPAPDAPPPAAVRPRLALAIVLGVLAGALVVLAAVALSRARH